MGFLLYLRLFCFNLLWGKKQTNKQNPMRQNRKKKPLGIFKEFVFWNFSTTNLCREFTSLYIWNPEFNIWIQITKLKDNISFSQSIIEIMPKCVKWKRLSLTQQELELWRKKFLVVKSKMCYLLMLFYPFLWHPENICPSSAAMVYY